MKIAILGPAGTYSEEAGRKYNKNAEFVYADFIGKVFDLVEKGEADLGIVPVENQINGAIGETLDNLFKRKLSVIDEIVLKIENVLAGQCPDFEVIISHPQPLGQCRDFIQKLGKKTEETTSTAKAMEIASKDSRYAAIGNRLAAETHLLKILNDDIQSEETNQTRFFVVSKKPINKFLSDKKYKTSIAIHPHEDRPGLLFEILRVFKDESINLTKIESRPSKDKLGDYIFYIDFEGDLDQLPVENALAKIKEMGDEVKVFGSYEKKY